MDFPYVPNQVHRDVANIPPGWKWPIRLDFPWAMPTASINGPSWVPNSQLGVAVSRNPWHPVAALKHCLMGIYIKFCGKKWYLTNDQQVVGFVLPQCSSPFKRYDNFSQGGPTRNQMGQNSLNWLKPGIPEIPPSHGWAPLPQLN